MNGSDARKFHKAHSGTADANFYPLVVGFYWLGFAGVHLHHFILLLRSPGPYLEVDNHKYYYQALVFLPLLTLSSSYTALAIIRDCRIGVASTNSWKWMAVTCGIVAADFLSKLTLFYS
jgi:hypothetical protein